MPGFADSFWTPDYVSGLEVLYSKLLQGAMENKQLLTVASIRADAEEQYGVKLGVIAPSVDKLTASGFNKDDGASVRKAYDGIRTEMVEASKSHQKISSNIRELVVAPFSRWSDQHEFRIQHSHDRVYSRIKEYRKLLEQVQKLRSQYFNRCRVVEDLEEENKLAFQSPDATNTPKLVLPEEEEDDREPVEIGDKIYTPEDLKTFLTNMLDNIKLRDSKVPILGTYHNTSTGADIVEYLQKHQGASTVSYAEVIGQDLVDNGFLRLIGNVGNTFANSSKMNYQWRSVVFKITGLPEKKKPMIRVSSMSSTSDDGGVDSPMSSVSEVLAGWNPLNNPHPNETPAEKLRREAHEADERYKAAVRRLDQFRCKLEEEIVDNLRFMEQCELDRLKAIKAVVLDFSGAISNVIPTLQSTVDHMMLYQETIQPLGDLRYLLENYRTGGFVPRVQPYENYYGSVEDQIFGVDLEARARADRKRVPIVITTILSYLDNRYPELEGDEARRAVWLYNVPLAATHQLRNALNNSKADYISVLEKFEIPVIASVLKLYFLELPDSLVSSQVYEIVKTVYSTTAHETTEEGRIKVLQSTLGQLRLNNIATLDAVMTHFTRLLELTSADDAYMTSLAQTLAPCILRPRFESSLTMNERHSYRLIRDLFDHKDVIFGELKRQSSAQGISNNGRTRAISTDESNRRAAMESRQRAIVDRSRAHSPAPRQKHRRDRSSGPENGRFPINVGSPTVTRRSTRDSLDVPGHRDSVTAADRPSIAESPQQTTNAPTTAATTTTTTEAPGNGDSLTSTTTTTSESSGSAPATEPDSSTATATATSPDATDGVEKRDGEQRDSISRSSARASRKSGLMNRSSISTAASVSTGAGEGETTSTSNRTSLINNDTENKGVTLEDKPIGVTLEDKPMDD